MFETLCSGKFLVQEYASAMSSISKGIGGERDVVARRVARIEALLSEFQRQTMTVDLIGFGPSMIDVLAKFKAPGSAASGAVGAFFSLYTDEDRDTYLQGGSVTGGNGGTETIANIKVKDADTGVGSLAGKRLYLKADCEATVDSGIMLPGCLLKGATCSLADTTTAGDIPPNHTFTTTAKTGSIYVEIGRWTADSFLPAAVGNVLASGCIGNFHLSRA
jgi:hypothetical protein